MAWGAAGVLGLAWLLAEVVFWPGPPPPGSCYQRIEGIRFCRSTFPPTTGPLFMDRRGAVVDPYDQPRRQFRWQV